MNERTATPGQPDPAEPLGLPAMEPAEATLRVVERFRAHGLASCATLGFEQSSSLAASMRKLTGEPCHSIREAQVLVRHNVDDEDIAIVYVDSPFEAADDLTVVDAAIAVLRDARDHLAKLQAADR